MLIVVSKAKAYAKEKHDMRLSTEFLRALSEQIKQVVDIAVEAAKADKRGTVKERDLGAQ